VATVEQLESVYATMRPLVAAVGPDQWSAPTPCRDWDVRALLAHVVAGNRIFAAAARGASLEEARRALGGDPLGPDPAVAYADAAAARRATLEEARRAVGEDPLGADPAAAYAEAAEELAVAFRAPGALERPMTIPFGTVPGDVALHLRIVEALVHGWDLAMATGRTVSYPDDVVEQEIAFSAEFLPRVPPDRQPFGPSRPVGADAPPLDRLVALLGRDPG
jgi:uncharacterized protein (TIGR03086 family)